MANKNAATDTSMMKDGAISINQVLYARHFRKNGIFPSSHALVVAARSSELGVSCGAASRVVRSMFYPDDTKLKRLPKRLVNLVPIIQELIARFRDADLDGLVLSLLRVPPAFRKFMQENGKLKSIAATTPSRAASDSKEANNLVCEVEMRALESEYMSQEDSDTGQSDRKRKRRELAIVSRSQASDPPSTSALLGAYSRPTKRPKRAVAASSSSSSSSLVNLSEHRDVISRLAEFVVPKRLVLRLVRKLVARVVPKEIWGQGADKKNWACVKELLQRLVNSQKYDVLSLKEVRTLEAGALSPSTLSR